MPLTGKQTRHLRGLGHHLDPVVQIGKNGITEALVAQLVEAVAHHELVKVRLLPECPADRHEAGGELAEAIGGELVQTLGRTLLFWKRNPAAMKVELPKASGKKPKPKAKEGEPEEAGQSTSKGKLPPSRAAHAERVATKEAEEKARAEARAKPFRTAPRGSGSRAGGGYRAGSGSRTGGPRVGSGSRAGAGTRGGRRPG